MQDRLDMLRKLYLGLVCWPIVFSVLAGGLILGWQCLHWLKFGLWHEVNLEDALFYLFGYPLFLHTGWLGLDRIGQWLVDYLPLALWLFILLPIIWIAVWRLILRWIFDLVRVFGGKRDA